MQKGSKGWGRGLAVRYPLRNTQILAEAQKKKKAETGWWLRDEVRDLTSKSSSEYRTLFLWKGWGVGGEKKASMITPLCLSLGLSVLLFEQQDRYTLAAQHDTGILQITRPISP